MSAQHGCSSRRWWGGWLLVLTLTWFSAPGCGPADSPIVHDKRRPVGGVVALTPDGKILASGGRASPRELWAAATGERLAALKGHDRGETELAFSPDGKTLAAAAGRTLAIGNEDSAVKLVDVATGKDRATFRPDVGWVHAVAFSPDGKLL